MSSSNIASVGYDANTRILEVEFKGGGVYQYEGVPPDLPDRMMQAESVGRFISQFVKPAFAGTKVS